MAGWTLRIATPNDARDLAAMHIASWREAYAGILPEKMLSSLSVTARAEAWERILRESRTERSTVVFLAEHDRRIFGFGSCGAQRAANLQEQGYDGEVSGVYVLRAFQKQGVGTGLFGEMSRDLIRRGFKAAALWVLRDNSAGRHFYERYGGQVIAEREDVRDGAVLAELAYGWPDLSELRRLLA
jgi:ribosomal protein S18 acetylase RimI-like enzyme